MMRGGWPVVADSVGDALASAVVTYMLKGGLRAATGATVPNLGSASVQQLESEVLHMSSVILKVGWSNITQMLSNVIEDSI
jgi:hypothetical protein